MHYSIFFLLTITIPSFAAFSGCGRTFSCGPIKNITYPFTGGDRPTYCGPPEFQLTCPDNSTYPDLLTNSSLTYRVLQLDQTRQTLKLARLDLYNNTCPKEFVNSTLNTTIFTNGIDNVELTLIYGCPLPPLFPLLNNMFSCNVHGSSFNNAYYFIGSDPVRNIISCAVSVTVSVIRGVGDELSSNTRNLVEVLSGGFNVNYRDVYTRHCSDCTLSGGLCGFDWNTSRPICICGDSLCVGAGKSSSSPNRLGIVLSVVGAVVAGVCAGWLIFFFRQRRKKRNAATSFTQTLSKDLPPSHSSTSLLTSPATHFSHTTPSYQTSISDVEKGSTYFGVQVFSYTQLVQATNNFDTSKELGDGGFGTVYYGTLQDGRVVAVKRLYENNFKRVEQFMNEVEILTRLDHENLVKLYGCTSKRSRELLLVYEYIPNGTVADHLHGKRANAGLLSWSVRLKIAVETAEALAYLHASDIIHRDVKTNNILLDNSFRVKVADFGLSRLFPNAATHVSTMPQGTPGYVDPEYYRCYKLTDKSDVYSFGVVLAELLSSLQAVDTDRHQKDINLASLAISKIQSQSYSELFDQSLGFEKNACVKKTTIMVGELAFRCLQEDKNLRPSMKEVLDILKGIQNEELDVQAVGVLDIVVDDGAPLKGKDPLRSPASVTDRWVSGSTQNSTD